MYKGRKRKGILDCQLSENKSKPKIEFSFEGDDEGSQTSGRGWATIDGKTLKGRIIFHMGDESSFSAKK